MTHPCINRAFLIVAVIALVVTAVGVPLWLLPYGIYFHDEPYQAVNALYTGDTPVALLTFALGNWWMSVMGNHLLSLRLLALLLTWGAVAVPSLWMWRRTGSPVAGAVVWAVLSLLKTVGVFYDWNVVSDFMLMVVMIASLEFWRRPGMGWVAVMAVGAAMAALSRVTSLSVLPVLACILILRSGWRRGLLYAGLGLAILMAAAWISIEVMCGSIGAYVELWNPDRLISGHADLVEIARRVFSKPVRVLVPLLLAWALHRGVAACFSRRWKWVSLAIAVVVAATLYYCNLHECKIFVFWYYFFVLLVVKAVGSRDVGRCYEPYGKAVAWIALTFAVLPMIGTNVILYRFYVLPVFPVLLTLFWGRRSMLSVLLPIAAAVALVATYGVSLYHYRWVGSGPLSASVELHDGMGTPLEGIRVAPNDARRIETNLTMLRRYGLDSDAVLMVGHPRYLYAMLGPARPAAMQRFEYSVEADSAAVVAEIERDVVGRPAVALLGEDDEFMGPHGSASAVERSVMRVLTRRGFTFADSTAYRLYIFTRSDAD